MPVNSKPDDQAARAPQSPVPEISLPKGGGAIQGTGEKFSSNAMTGTGSLTVPIVLSPGRSGFGPQIALGYDSGRGNGVFGIGWSLSLPSITRKTEKGLPQYRDQEESDVFILSGSEDLVPVLQRDARGEWRRKETEHDGFRVHFYRPRIEGLFARIEKWTRTNNGEVHWRAFTKDNLLTIYGESHGSRISDPEQPLHIFQWLVSSSYDAKGNAIVYEYSAEDMCGVDTANPSERRRGRPSNRYLKRILYGNRKPVHFGSRNPEDAGWMFEVVLDYGDEDYRASRDSDDEEFTHWIGTTSDVTWTTRRDPFSSYRAGFEIRTYRLCRRILMVHRFNEELGTPRYLVRSTEFHYDQKMTGSFLTGVVGSGYTRLSNGFYRKKSLPRLDLAYTQSPLEVEFPGPFELQRADSQNLPTGIGGQSYRWIDLNGEGISGVLTEQGSGWYYKRNLGQGRFTSSRLVANKPASGELNSIHQQLMDVGGKGQLDLVDLAPGRAGFYERVANVDGADGLDSGWGRFRPFRALPIVDWRDPNLRFVDLTGDGIADILITEDVAFRWHPSLQSQGFGASVRIPAPSHEEDGPRVVFADPMQSIYLADMSGDGLTDIVRIRSGEVCYWPNLGYGRFGAKIVMDGSPWFEQADLFDNRRIRLADTDGSGTIDILYIAEDEVHVYLNQSGNSLSQRKTLRGLPTPGTNDISVADFLGRGTACLVWSSALPADSRHPLRYVDLMNGKKPHLLNRVANNLGMETVVEYASSTEFYLADKAAGHPWVTPLPFPVHVVKRIETFDYVSQHRFVSSSSYHHGYYDGVEREFRGFGRIEQRDTEEFGSVPDRFFPAGLNEAAAWRVPPALTKTWYHTGVFLGVDRISRHLAHEYYREPGEQAALRLDDTVLPSELSPEEAREGCRALKGSMLRQEVYALDDSREAARPYTVAEGNSTVHLLQPRGLNLHCVFFVHSREGLAVNYERKLYQVGDALRADPRVAHTLTLEVDEFGNVLKSASIAYGRRFPDRSHLLTDSDHQTQARLQAVVTENSVTNAIDTRNAYRTPVAAESRMYELIHLKPPAKGGGKRLLRFEEIREQVSRAGDGRHDLTFEDVNGKGAAGPEVYRRLIQKSRMFYRSDALDRLLPLGKVESLALAGDSYSLALTPGLISHVYHHKLAHPQQVLRQEGGYVDLDGDAHWWAPAGRIYYSPRAEEPAAELEHARRHFYVPRRFQDVFGNVFHIAYDAHDLSAIETRDPAGNIVHAQLDYRVLQPRLVTDANGNRSAAAFDSLGVAVGTAIMGKAGERVGDSLEGFSADLPQRIVREHLHNPLARSHEILGGATTRILYDLFAFTRTCNEPHPQPMVTCVLAREKHLSDLAPGEQSRIQNVFSYADGFGREVQKKIRVAPGPIPGQEKFKIDPRWVGSGWTIFNNKGNPVRQYEPFFSSTHHFEFAVMVGVGATLLYDPTGRIVSKLNPNHTFEKTVFDPWSQEIWDANDTVEIDPAQDPDVGHLFRLLPQSEYLPTWYRQRVAGAMGSEERNAALKAAAHARTPGVMYCDALGRVFLTVADNAGAGKYPSRIGLDIQGNQRSVRDSIVEAGDREGRVVMRYDYDMRRNQIHQSSMEAGQRWMLVDAAAKAIRAWDSRGHHFRADYDMLRRPVSLFVHGRDPVHSDPRTIAKEILYEKIVYGEGQPAILNLNTRVFQHRDGAGVVTNMGHNVATGQDEGYDFKGNLLRSSRQLPQDFKALPDWFGATPSLLPEIFVSSTQYDALNRPIVSAMPDGTVVQPVYDEGNFITTINANLRGAPAAPPFVARIDYNAKGQRLLIEHGNETVTTYTYDPLTFRLDRLVTRRSGFPARQQVVQDLTYTYDPVGNIAHIRDDADIHNIVFFRNQRIEPSADYTYDAIYRLIRASGREQLGSVPVPTSYNDVPRAGLLSPSDGNAMGRYTEQYEYDPAGNFLKFIHRGADPANPGWTRSYTYQEASELESEKKNNRLSSTAISANWPVHESYTYDVHGSMTSMPHLQAMQWSFQDRLEMTRRQAVNAEDQEGKQHQGERTYYVYDAAGQRVRKATESSSGVLKKERLYLGAFELYREYDSNGEVTLARETVHIMDDSRRIALLETATADSEASPSSLPSTTIRYQFENHLGTACLELDENAALISYEEYYPYGSTSYQAGRTLAEVALKRYRYTGKERDEETGLYYHGARYYAPWLAVWTSADRPAMPAGETNLYTYALRNPIKYFDPDGHAPELTDSLTRHFNIVVPAIFVAAARKGLSVEAAYFLIIQSFQEQKEAIQQANARYRLFNEHAPVELGPDGQPKKVDGKIYINLTNEEKTKLAERHISIEEIPQREEQKGKKGSTIKISPTYTYESPEASVEHHVELLKSKWDADLNTPMSFETFAHKLDKFATVGTADPDPAPAPEASSDGQPTTPAPKKVTYTSALIDVRKTVNSLLRQWLAAGPAYLEKQIADVNASIEVLKQAKAKLEMQLDSAKSLSRSLKGIGIGDPTSEFSLIETPQMKLKAVERQLAKQQKKLESLQAQKAKLESVSPNFAELRRLASG